MGSLPRSAAIARALGAGRRDDADALIVHALAIAVGFGLLFMLAVLGGEQGPQQPSQAFSRV